MSLALDDGVLRTIYRAAAGLDTWKGALSGSMFDLTPAEVQIALALTQGQSVKDIATQRRTAVYTVRSQVKSLFEKTETRRQADLVRLVTRLTET